MNTRNNTLYIPNRDIKTKTELILEATKYWNDGHGLIVTPQMARLLRKAGYTENYTEAKPMSDAIICDLDGTLALMGDRKPYGRDIDVSTDTLNMPIFKLVIAMWVIGYDIIFVSGREDIHREATVKWLNKLFEDSPYRLFMRKEGDYRKDSIVKREIYDLHIKNEYDIEFVLDDRNQVVEMWRSIGLTCLQVAEGDF